MDPNRFFIFPPLPSTSQVKMWHTVAVTTAVLAISYVIVQKIQERLANLPPGPLRLPLLGNIPSLSPDVPLDFTRLARAYGPLYRLWLGNKLAIVISDSSLMKEALNKQSAVFSGRPFPYSVSVAHSVPHGESCPVGLLFSDYDEHCKTRRNILLSKLLKPARLKPCIYDQLRRLHKSVDACAQEAKELDLERVFREITTNVISLAGTGVPVFSDAPAGVDDVDSEETPNSLLENSNVTKEDLRDLHHALSRLAEITSSPMPGDQIPWLRFVDKKKLGELAAASQQQTRVLQKMVDEHKATLDPENPRDIIDEFLLSSEAEVMNGKGVIGILSEAFAAGTTTTSDSLQWIFMFFAKHQDVQNRAREELLQAYPDGAVPENLDISGVPYFEAAIKEAIRVRPVTPILLPHKTTENTTLAGYNIPAGTFVFINYWGITHDSATIEKPDDFIPERFLQRKTEEATSSTSDLACVAPKYYTPFGTGPRICPGAVLAELEMRTISASLLMRYEFLPSPTSPLDFRPLFAIAMHPKTPPKLHVKKLTS